MIKDRLLAAYSLTTLSLFTIWVKILNRTHYLDYPGFEYDIFSVGITLFWMLVTAGALTLLFQFHYRPTRVAKYVIVTLFLVMSLNGIRLQMGLKKDHVALIPMILGMFVGGGFFFLKFKGSLWTTIQKTLIILSPFAFFVTILAVWELLPAREVPQRELEVYSRTENPSRIVWMVFDELDIRLAFEQRGLLSLPHLDRFKSEALFASQAYSAASRTLNSIPSMLSGLNLGEPTIINDHEIRFTRLDTQENIFWSEISHIFLKAHTSGFRTAILGNYHPYQRLLGYKPDYPFPTCKPPIPFSEKFYQYSVILFQKLLLDGFPFLRSLGFSDEFLLRQQFIDCYRHMMHHSRIVCRDPSLDFIFIHWPIPHYPGIYQASNKQHHPHYEANYLDNLVLVDDTLGILIEEMEKANLWDETTVIISSDHWLRRHNLDTSLCKNLSPFLQETIRQSDCRVPLLIKMANQHQPLVYSEKLRTFQIYGTIEKLLNKEISTSEELIEWFKRQEKHFSLKGLT